MSSRKLKCYGWCDEKYIKLDLIKFKNKNYCFKCYARKTEEAHGYEVLKQTISEVFNIPYPTGLMLRQMKTFFEERNYTYIDQANALKYGREVLKKTFTSNYGLGLVPYIIDEARGYYIKRDKQMENMKDVNALRKVETVDKSVAGFYQQRNHRSKMIDIESELL